MSDATLSRAARRRRQRRQAALRGAHRALEMVAAFLADVEGPGVRAVEAEIRRAVERVRRAMGGAQR